MDDVGKMFKLRVLLVLVDDEHNLQALQELNKLAFAHGYTLILAWSNLECARYLETLKFYDGMVELANFAADILHVNLYYYNYINARQVFQRCTYHSRARGDGVPAQGDAGAHQREVHQQDRCYHLV